MTKKQPFCWKCGSKITESNPDGKSSSLIGCKEEENIHNYKDAEKLCPLIKDKSYMENKMQYVYCYTCKKLLAKCYDSKSAIAVGDSHNLKFSQKHTVIVGTKDYFDKVYPSVDPSY